MPHIRPYLRKCAVRRLHGPLTEDARSKSMSSCAAALQAGATALAINPAFPSGSKRDWAPLLREIFDLCHAQGVLSMVVDDVLLLMQTGAQAVCFTRCPPSYARVREVVGPQVYLGRSFADQAEVEEVKASGRFAHLDFCVAGRWGISATETISGGQAPEANLDALNALFANRPSLLLHGGTERPFAGRSFPHWDGYLLQEEECQPLGETVLVKPIKPRVGPALASPQLNSEATRNHG